MIYLPYGKYDIIPVSSYAVGVYHPPKVDIIPKVYHPVLCLAMQCMKRISLKIHLLQPQKMYFSVEMRGVEPLSEIPANQPSTSLVTDIGLSRASPQSQDTLGAVFKNPSLSRILKDKAVPGKV